jgi:hypothetical protein
MNLAHVEQIAQAVLYEGYLLYPYRPSSVKNRQRWTFGGIYPEAYSIAQGGAEPWNMQTQCLVAGAPHSRLHVWVRFLHLLERVEERPNGPMPEAAGAPWQEAVERAVELPDLFLGELAEKPWYQDFAFPASENREPMPESAGLIVRRQQAIQGVVEASARRLRPDLFQVTVRILNRTPVAAADCQGRDAASMVALVSTHTILHLRDGAFISLIDPPEDVRSEAAACQNVGAWPVLVGESGERDAMLASPIILYDYPQIAPESPGDLFDATEIDEILTLRILTLTDEEKKEMSGSDARARALLERTEALAREQLMNLHGAVRGLRPLPAAAKKVSGTLKSQFQTPFSHEPEPDR